MPPRKNPLLLTPDTLYSGDCLEVMRAWPDGIVDLIYLDPPFNSNRDYNVLFGKDKAGRELDEDAQFVAFKDTWHYTTQAHMRVLEILDNAAHPAHNAIAGFNLIIPESPMLAYLSYMAERLVEAYYMLKSTGSLYLHCDPTASHHLKIVLDEIFGRDNFRNEIIWHYSDGTGAKLDFKRKHDIIFRYSKTASYVYNKDAVRIPSRNPGRYNKTDEQGRKYFEDDRRYDPPRRYYADTGIECDDVWTFLDDNRFRQLNSMSKERLDWPTQKPLALLERIVQASSNPGDWVLDPFCGCGTTAHAAFNLKRKFLGVDISVYALNKICKARLKNVKNLQIKGLPSDFAAAKKMDPFAFEQWTVTLMQGFKPNNKQTGDGGVDGYATLLHKPVGENGLVIAQVKQLQKGSYAVDAQRALLSKITGGQCSMGIFVTLYKMPDTKTKLDNIRHAGFYTLSGGTQQHPRLVYWSIEEYFHSAQPPLPEMQRTRDELQLDWMTE